MKFKFSFEKLLGHKKVLEDVARRDFVEAQNKLEREVARVNMFRNELDNAYKHRFKTQQSGGLVAAEIKSINEFMDGKKIEIEKQDQIIVGFEKIVEEKRKRLVEAAQDHKTYEKLKEKKHLDFKTMVKKKETKSLDELIVTYAKRGRHNG